MTYRMIILCCALFASLVGGFLCSFIFNKPAISAPFGEGHHNVIWFQESDDETPKQILKRTSSFQLDKDAVINSIMKECPDQQIKVALYDLDEQKYLIKPEHDDKIQSASLIKLLILAYSMEQKQQNPNKFNEDLQLTSNEYVKGSGILQYIPANVGEKFTLNNLDYLMITKSDNIAANILIKQLGMSNINHFADQLRLSGNTHLYNLLMLPQNKFLSCSDTDAHCNSTSVEDMVKLLRFLSRYPEAMLFLEHQEDRSGIPATFDKLNTAIVHNKTGTLTQLRSDAAIIDYNQHRYVLVIAVKNADKKQGDKIIQEISSTVLKTFIDPSITATKLEKNKKPA